MFIPSNIIPLVSVTDCAMCVFIIDVVIFVLSMGTTAQLSTSPQDNITSEHCLEWDVQLNKCGECEEGYFGLYCKMECRYPSYGKNCQLECYCPPSNCSFISGCEVGSPTLSTKTQDSSNGFIPKISRAPNSAVNVCLAGYQGDNCDIKCRYPNYGDGCQSMCLCEKEHCYHDTGCKVPYNHCERNYSPQRRNALIYSITVLGVWAVIQYTVYIYLSFVYKT